jgi:DNA-binding NarL/FixJ family response regulator
MKNRPRVLLAEDHPAAAQQLRNVLETVFEVVDVVADGAALVEAAATLRPDAIVTDIAMPVLDGVAATARILLQNPDARIVFVTVHREAAIVQRGLAAGALGYVLKAAAGEDLIPAVQAVLRGNRYASAAAGAGLAGLSF